MQKFTPHEYQRYCIDEIERLPACALWLDMGLGKTVITLTAIQELKYHAFQVRRALVIAPKKVAEATWTDEAAKWEHLQGLRISVVLGSAAERLVALDAAADVYVINRENVAWLVEHFRNGWPFDMVVLDESSSFKNHQAKRFKALRAVRPHISRMVELTGTPSPNSLMDLWAQAYLLDGGQRLGKSIGRYREIWFLPDKRNRVMVLSYKPREGAEQEIYDALSDVCVSMKASDYLQLPEMVTDDIPVALDEEARARYADMERTMVMELEDGETVTAASAAALTGKLLQLCNGAVYGEDGTAIGVHACKVSVFLETIEQLGGQHALVYYHFRHDLERLQSALDGTGLRVRVYEGPEEERDWNGGKIDVLLAQPASCGYGLNLQAGGHHVIWFGLTWSLEEYLQANARLHRQGQEHPVIVHRLVVRGGMDEMVVRALECKDRCQDALLEALKARVEKVREEAG